MTDLRDVLPLLIAAGVIWLAVALFIPVIF